MKNHKGQLCGVALLLFLTAGVVVGDGVSFGLSGLTVQRFKYQGDGYLIAGKEAVTKGDKVDIQRVQVHLDNDGNPIRIFSPSVTFDRKSQRGSGEERVQVRSSSFTMEGVGFDADFKRGRIRLRKNVKITIYDSAVNLLESTPGKE